MSEKIYKTISMETIRRIFPLASKLSEMEFLITDDGEETLEDLIDILEEAEESLTKSKKWGIVVQLNAQENYVFDFLNKM